MKNWLAVALLIPVCAACFWVSSTILTFAGASCCSGTTLWDSFAPAAKLAIGGLVLWHAAAAIVAAVAALGLSTRLLRF